MRACSLKHGITTVKGGSTEARFRVLVNRDSSIQRCKDLTIHDVLFVNLHDKLAVWIDVPAIHSRGIKRQRDAALAIDCDQAARATKFRHPVESHLGGSLE